MDPCKGCDQEKPICCSECAIALLPESYAGAPAPSYAWKSEMNKETKQKAKTQAKEATALKHTYFRENKVKIYHLEFSGWHLQYGTRYQEPGIVEIAFSICNPRDRFTHKKGSQLIFERFQNREQRFLIALYGVKCEFLKSHLLEFLVLMHVYERLLYSSKDFNKNLAEFRPILRKAIECH